jgi:2-polyprenyl-3-methyl-5-hydroxy-6-metoxy-1,4-benzoquinol methylase
MIRMHMSADEKREFPHWEELYQEREIESMPWFNRELDDDLKQALDELGVWSGSALDLGTGPGTQAMHLARRGFDVTATDISGAAMRVARGKAQEQGLDITWEEDDILNTRLTWQFDLVFDRGCFHVLPPERRPRMSFPCRAAPGLLHLSGAHSVAVRSWSCGAGNDNDTSVDWST